MERSPYPDHLPSGGNHAQLADIDFDDRTLGQDAELSIHGVLRVLLDLKRRLAWADIEKRNKYRDDGKLDGNSKLWVCDVAFLVSKTHGSDESLVLDRPSREVYARWLAFPLESKPSQRPKMKAVRTGSDKCRLCDHSLPSLLRSLLSRLDEGVSPVLFKK